MAIVEQFFARVQIGDSAKVLRSASLRVDPTDARAYIAAANQAARDATKVGLLLDSLIDMTLAEGTNIYKEWGLDSHFINDAFAYAPKDGDVYNSNQWKVTGACLNNGLPSQDSFYIPSRATDVVMESNGVNALLTDTKVANLVTQVIDTGVSRYGTPFTSILEVTVNDV